MSEHNAKNRKIAVFAVTAALVLGGGGAAFAYWTSTGSGTGTATTGESTDWVVTSSPAIGGPLTPDGPSQSVAFNVANPSTGSQELTSVVVTVANGDGSAWTSGDCSAADYVVDAPVIVYGTVAGSADVDGTVTISMIDTGVNQDDCQTADVPLYFVAS